MLMTFSPPNGSSSSCANVQASEQSHGDDEQPTANADETSVCLVFSPGSIEIPKNTQVRDTAGVPEAPKPDTEAIQRTVDKNMKQILHAIKSIPNHLERKSPDHATTEANSAQINELVEANTVLMSENERLKSKINSIEKHLAQEKSSHDDERSQLLILIEQMKQEVSDLGHRRDEEVLALTASMTSKEKEREALHNQLVAKDDELQKLSMQITEIKEKQDEIIEESSSTERQFRSKLESLIDENAALSTRLDKVQQEKTTIEDQLNAQVEALENARHEAESKLCATTAELSREKKAILASERKLEAAMKKSEKMKGGAKEAETELAAEREKVLEATNRLQEASLAISSLEQELDSRKNNVEVLDSQLCKIKKQCEITQQELDTERQTSAKQKDLLSESQKMVAEAKEYERSMKQSIQESREELKQKVLVNDDLLLRNEDLQEQLRKLEEKIEHLTGKLASERESKTELAEQSKKQIDKLERSIRESDSELMVAKQKMKELEGQVDIAKRQVTALSESKDEVLLEKAATLSELESLSARLKQESDLVQVLEKESTARKEESEQKHARIRELENTLQVAKRERDRAIEHAETFDGREAELHRKLRVMDEVRRGLHNKMMQLSGNIKVYVRVRPALAEELVPASVEGSSLSLTKAGHKRKHAESEPEMTPFRFPGVCDRDETAMSGDDLLKNLIEVTEPYKDRGGLKSRRKTWKFGFDNVFAPTHSQDDLWEATAPLVQSAIDGYNVCIFAYGQTGSGKTFTMLGNESSEGIIPRAVKKLFDYKQDIELASAGTKVSLSVELLEIYNEQLRDLLAPNSGPRGKELKLKVTSGTAVGNVLVPVTSVDEVLAVLSLAQTRRCVKATKSNSESSRSHMLFTIHFHVESNEGVSRYGKLHVCDLAGSERLNKSGSNEMGGGSLLTETKHINSSLSVLSNVIESIQSGNPHIPYRDSKLTFLLQNSLGGDSKTLAIVCCNPLSTHYHESLCSLRFASKVNKVELKALANFTC